MKKSYKNFRQYVDGFAQFDKSCALTIRRFVRLEKNSYVKLHGDVLKTANYLASLGAKKGDRIMIMAPNCPEWVTLFLAAQISGIVVVSVDVASGAATVEKFADITDPKYIFSSIDKNFFSGIKVQIENLFDLQEKISKLVDKFNSPELTGEEGTVIVFTSGTTADPKGVVLTQKNILSNLAETVRLFDVNPSWQFLSVLPLSHMYELTVGCLLPLSVGGGVFYLSRVTPLAIARAMKEYQVTVVAAVPQLGSMMMKKIELTAEREGLAQKLKIGFKISQYLPHRLRRIVFGQVLSQLGGKLDIFAFGGAAPDIEVVRKWELMGVKVVQGYGLTETSPLLAGNIIPKRRMDSQGKILSNIDWKLSEENELLVKGPSVFSGYYKNTEATKSAFTKDGYFRTGDVGRVDAGGWLYLNGRAKFAIVLPSGLKVFPEDIEIAAHKSKLLENCCVTGMKTSDGESVLMVVASKAKDTEIQEAVDEMNNGLESFQRVTRWMRWPGDDFPRTRLLKVERRAVQAWANGQELDKRVAKSNPETASDPIFNLVSKVLDKTIAGFSEDTKLSDMGLDSLKRLMLVSLVEEEMGVAILEKNINQNTKLSDLRKMVEVAAPVHEEKPQASWQYGSVARLIGNFLSATIIPTFTAIWVKYRVLGRENIKDSNSPTLIVFNHVDWFDIPIVYGSLPKNIRKKFAVAAAKDVFQDYPAVGFLARLLYGGFELSRTEPVLPSLKFASDLLASGRCVAIAPEGQISLDGKLGEFKSGIGLLAVECGVPVIAITTSGLAGTMSLHKPWPKRHSHVVVKISRPMYFDHTFSYEKATEEIRKEIQLQIESVK